MTVRDLIHQLRELPMDLPVVKDGYEGGLDNISGPQLILMRTNVNTEWYYGKHEAVIHEDETSGTVEAVRIV